MSLLLPKKREDWDYTIACYISKTEDWDYTIACYISKTCRLHKKVLTPGRNSGTLVLIPTIQNSEEVHLISSNEDFSIGVRTAKVLT
jgi:hypothetical protein